MTAGIPRNDQAREVREEMRQHLEGLRDDLVAEGWEEGAPTREALRRMGDAWVIRRLWIDRVVDGRPLAAALLGGVLALQVGAESGCPGSSGGWRC